MSKNEYILDKGSHVIKIGKILKKSKEKIEFKVVITTNNHIFPIGQIQTFRMSYIKDNYKIISTKEKLISLIV